MDARIDTQPGRIAISGEMTIYGAAELKEQLFPLVRAAQQNLQIDLSGVTTLDTAGLQLLLMLKRVAKLVGVDASLGAVSPAVQDVLTLCRIDNSLQTGNQAAAS